ncbi:MAG: hypothetical protein V6Z81_05155, partial [Parvularculales bacterium]
MRVSTISLFAALALCSVLASCGGGGGGAPSGGNSGGVTPPPATQTCGTGSTSSCIHGCIRSDGGPDVARDRTAPGSVNLTCKREPAQTCQCTHGCTVSTGGELVNNAPLTNLSTTTTTTLTCKPEPTQTCLCTGGCRSSAGGNVAHGRTAPASARLTCVAEASPQTCSSPQGCMDSDGYFVAFGSAVSASITLIPLGAATQTCGTGSTSSCIHGCMTTTNTLVANGGVATASETLRCQLDPNPPICGQSSGTADCTFGCTANGSVYVPLNTAAPALTTTTTLTCRTEAPPGMQICECFHDCTGDDSNEYNNNALASDSVRLTCKTEAAEICKCAFGCTVSGGEHDGDDVLKDAMKPLSETATSELMCKSQSQTCSCEFDCEDSDGTTVRRGSTASDTNPLNCKSRSQTCNCDFGCTTSDNRDVVNEGTASDTESLMCKYDPNRPICNCAFGCTNDNGPDLMKDETAPAATTNTKLTCKTDPDPPECGTVASGTDSCDMTLGCETVEGSIYVPHGRAAEALMTETTLQCRTGPPPGFQFCECTHGCTRDDGQPAINDRELAPVATGLTCRGEPNPPVCGTAPGTASCGFGCTSDATPPQTLMSGDTADASTTGITTLSCQSRTLTCGCDFDCTDSSGATVALNATATDTVDLTCKENPSPPTCGQTSDTTACAHGCM